MLDNLILGMDYGISYGSGALKALQNDDIPELDLLVREAIQNSSDASLDQSNKFDCVNINFNQGTFSPRKLNAVLKGLTEILDKRYPILSADFLEIRDYKTTGLTGPVRKSELNPMDHGNYFKLVFDTGKEQTYSNEGEAGGSWGYGKSVYYRVGIGLVIFYSQIKVEDRYESRLIISLIEHETNEKALLKEVKCDSVGRAWWGKKDPNDNCELLPVTDSAEIQLILDIFSINKFSDDQTGTSIIIPYIDKARLLSGIFPEKCGISDEEIAMCSFKSDIAQYIELAIQKWYAPRIFNKSLKKYSGPKWLAVRINDKPLRNTDMRPFFQLVQELYTTALSANYSENEQYKSNLFADIKCITIPSQRLVAQNAGHAASIKITQDELSSSSSMIKPYTYLRLFGKSTLNDPIVMFARTPGMVLDYKIDGKWTKGLSKPENDDEYCVVFYVPNCAARIHNDTSMGDYAGMALGEYLRKSEKSDHMEWTDPASLTIITNIKNQVVSKVNQLIKEEDSVPVEGTASKLSGKLGRRLLPSMRFGQKAKGSASGSSGGGSGGTVSDNFELIFENPVVSGNYLELAFTAKFKSTRKRAQIGLFVESETGLLDAYTWHSDIGTAFPLSIIAIKDCKTIALNSGKDVSFQNTCTPEMPSIENEFTSIKINTSTDSSDVFGFVISNSISNAVISGILIISTVDRKYCCTIKESKKNTQS